MGRKRTRPRSFSALERIPVVFLADVIVLCDPERADERRARRAVNPRAAGSKGSRWTTRSPAAELDALLPSVLVKAFKGEL